ncbi:hypothetical protein ACLKA7_001454 [Drosophila subpalustris]
MERDISMEPSGRSGVAPPPNSPRGSEDSRSTDRNILDLCRYKGGQRYKLAWLVATSAGRISNEQILHLVCEQQPQTGSGATRASRGLGNILSRRLRREQRYITASADVDCDRYRSHGLSRRIGESVRARPPPRAVQQSKAT